MRLQDVATIAACFPDADFWIVRRGSLTTVGRPTYTFNREHIGIKVVRTDLILPQYLYYSMVNIFESGSWQSIATGTTALVNLRVSDIKHIALKAQQQ